jgi:lysophospholipase
MWKWEAKGQAKAVIILVHSAYEHHLRYAWQIEQWRSADFHVIMGDLPGHGKEAAAEQVHKETFKEYEKSLKISIRAALENELPVFIVAHGLGATLVINLLSKTAYPIAGIVLSSPWLRLLKTPTKLPSALTGLHKLTPNMSIEHHIGISDLTRNQEVIDQEQNDPLYKPVATAGWYYELQGSMRQAAQSIGQFPDIPVFLHTGGADRIADKEAAKRWLQQQNLKEFSYKEWSRYYHDVFQEPEREDLFFSSHLFLQNAMRLLGYVVT